MTEYPILFSGPMVRAIIEGRKAITRRVIKPQPFNINGSAFMKTTVCPYGQPGDRLWVRETFAPRYFDNGKPAYRADWDGKAADLVPEPRWSPSIHMPRWASRITLEITAVRVERVQDISEYDAGLEGAPCLAISKLKHPPIGLMQKIQAPEAFVYGFYDLWNSINAKRGYGWDANPWVWVVEFKRIEP